jgi:hypothetical protein
MVFLERFAFVKSRRKAACKTPPQKLTRSPQVKLWLS